ncbi:type II secretion system protein [Uliginosibacterium sp. 31-16]|uniref:type II secretion system protein n=1 Tax=Uliginosibacterium sp. 31-16 TaxID=3068315 RepID=UPI00273FF1B4|nr:type II secretion system protein [Uliginosibacterium sp. 31-16]MDP5241227.1 type II secretion system protein [Uliginosibacterium sp. 31-16]
MSEHPVCRIPQRGFTLVELAIALTIIAILASGALFAFSVQIERSRRLESRNQIDDAREALLLYAAANQSPAGALPCPAASAESGIAAASCTGADVTRGFLPWQTLGLPQTDGFGQTLRYAVSCKYVKTPSLASEGDVNIRSKDASGTETSLSAANSVALAIWSVGGDGVDASPTSGSNVIGQSPADDQVVWVSRYIVLGRLLAAGHNLSSAATLCP